MYVCNVVMYVLQCILCNVYVRIIINELIYTILCLREERSIGFQLCSNFFPLFFFFLFFIRIFLNSPTLSIHSIHLIFSHLFFNLILFFSFSCLLFVFRFSMSCLHNICFFNCPFLYVCMFVTLLRLY